MGGFLPLPEEVSLEARLLMIKEECGTVVVTTSSMTMQTMAVTKAMDWLETPSATHVCILNYSKSMLNKIQTGHEAQTVIQVCVDCNV